MVIARKKRKRPELFDCVNLLLLTLVCLTMLYPFVNLLFISVSRQADVSAARGMLLYPKSIQWNAYQYVFSYDNIWRAYENTLFITLVGTCLSLLLTCMAGYSLSKRGLPGRSLMTVYVLITMFINGGLIPTYLVVKQLGLMGSPWVVILLGSVSVYNIIIARSFFTNNIPPELFEAASIDGCGNGRFFISIVVPLSKSIIAVLALYYAVAQWNGYFNALVYLNRQEQYPLQLILREILISSQMVQADVSDLDAIQEMQRIAATVKYGVIVVASVPMLIIYPLVQKYFVKGVMIGSVKG